MKKNNTSPLSGMQELLPAQQAIFNKLKASIGDVFHYHGFQSIETPTIDRTDILLAKAGGDTEKQIYKVIKTEEVVEDSDQALRFDLTVPLARYVVEHKNDLAFPFRVAQIGRSFRGERAQKGRFREFYQLDVDVIGRDELPVAYDAEAIATIYEALKTFSLPEMRIRISNRKILSGFLAALNLSDKTPEISSIIDRAEKVSPEATNQALKNLNLSEENVAKITTFINIKGSRNEVSASLDKLNISNNEFKTGKSELLTVLDLLAKKGLKENAIGDLMIIRGLDYYTGTVFETFLPEHRAIGSIASGGRYENLASSFTDQRLPGVGGSIGLTRLFYILNENNLLNLEATTPIDVVIAPISENEYEYSFRLADNLRSAGKSVDIIMTNKKLGDKLTYASKIASNAIVIGENEATSGNTMVKNLTTGELSTLDDYLRI
jgi:histidyl-tRNA synthetase